MKHKSKKGVSWAQMGRNRKLKTKLKKWIKKDDHQPLLKKTK